MNVLIETPEGGLDRPSIVKTSHILTISKGRLMKRLGLLFHSRMEEVEQAIKLSLNLT